MSKPFIKTLDDLLNITVCDHVTTDDALRKYCAKVDNLCKSAQVEFNLVKVVQYYLEGYYEPELITKVIKDNNYHKNLYDFFETLDITYKQEQINFIFNIDAVLKKHELIVSNYSCDEFYNLCCIGLTRKQKEQLFYPAVKFYCEKYYEVNTDNFTDKMFSMAYEKGHSSGAYEIFNVYSDLYDLYEIYAELKWKMDNLNR